MQKNTGQGISQHRVTNSCLHILIPPGLLMVPPAGSCHSNLGSGMCSVPIPVRAPDSTAGRQTFPLAIQGAAALAMGLLLLQCLSRSPLQSPHSLGESTQCPEVARSARTWSKGFTQGVLLLLGSVKAWDGDSVTRQEGYGVSGMEKEMLLIPQGQSSPCGKTPSQTTQGSLEILQGRIPHGHTICYGQGQHPPHGITFVGWLCPAEQRGVKPLQA